MRPPLLALGAAVVGIIGLACGGLGGDDRPPPAAPESAPKLPTQRLDANAYHPQIKDVTDIHTVDDAVVALRANGEMVGLNPIAVVPLASGQTEANGAWVRDGMVRFFNGGVVVDVPTEGVVGVHSKRDTLALLDRDGQATCVDAPDGEPLSIGQGDQVFAGVFSCCVRSAEGDLTCSTREGARFSAQGATGEVDVGLGFVCFTDGEGHAQCTGPEAPLVLDLGPVRSLSAVRKGRVCALDGEGAPLCWDRSGAVRYELTGRGKGTYIDLAVLSTEVVLLRDDGTLASFSP